MNMKATYLAAALIGLIGYLSIQLAEARMGLDKELAIEMDVQR